MRNPKVSVIMPVYNAGEYVATAIESILKQSFGDFELLVVDDGSTDRSAEVVAGYSDPRLRRVENERNLGIAATRNRSIELARGRYIAWLDADDMSARRRLEKQVCLFESEPDIGICGTWVKPVGISPESVWRYPTDSAFLRSRMIFDSPLATSSVMMRRELIDGAEAPFDPSFPPAEDYDLWERLSRNCNVTNLPEVLTYYRVHAAQTSLTKADQRRQSVIRVQRRQLERLGILPSPAEMELHLAIGVEWATFSTTMDALRAQEWLHRLVAANGEHAVYPADAFRSMAGERWWYICRTLSDPTANRDALFRSSSLSRHVGLSRRARSFLGSLVPGPRL
jgi:glycosyltransferase involved in cell wall biosynthesis